MKFQPVLTTTTNAVIIGMAYAATYFVAATNSENILLVAAFFFGALVYLSLRLSYKQDQETNKLLFKSYSLVSWSVAIILFIIHFYLYFDGIDSKEFIDYKSFEDLLYFGPLVIAMWPLFLISYLIGNFFIFFEKIFLFLQLPVTILLSCLLIIGLGFSYKRLYDLKQKSTISFSIPVAFVRSIVPIFICTYLLIEVVPLYIK